jgi:hypothetical protein
MQEDAARRPETATSNVSSYNDSNVSNTGAPLPSMMPAVPAAQAAPAGAAGASPTTILDVSAPPPALIMPSAVAPPVMVVVVPNSDAQLPMPPPPPYDAAGNGDKGPANVKGPDKGPDKGPEKEPMLLLDVTGSMTWAASAKDDRISRKAVVGEAIRGIVHRLGVLDSQADKEKESEGGEGGGLFTVTFADGSAKELGDLNAGNLTSKWNSINWGGGTAILPGWTLLKQHYQEEFGKLPESDQPQMVVLVITDGVADDTDAFAAALRNEAAGRVFVELAIIGYGEEHDRAVDLYRKIAANNAHLRVIPFASETDPDKIANELTQMFQ